jgi:hypothetical protein
MGHSKSVIHNADIFFLFSIYNLFRDGTDVTGPLAGGLLELNKVWSRCGADQKGISQGPKYLSTPISIEQKHRTLQSTSSSNLLSFQSIKNFISNTKVKMCRSSPVKSLKSYAAAIFGSPVNQVDNDRYTVCWNCFVRNYKPHDGRCFNCGITM